MVCGRVGISYKDGLKFILFTRALRPSVRKGWATSIFALILGMGWDCCRERIVKVELTEKWKKLLREWAKIGWDFSGIPNLGILGFLWDKNPGIWGFFRDKNPGIWGFFRERNPGIFDFYADKSQIRKFLNRGIFNPEIPRFFPSHPNF